MLHIVLSRAALFPWLGLALMAAGALLPEGNVVAIVLVVIGANFAFYSLRDFSQNFAWGADSRPMLVLCGVVFLLGLALLANSTLTDSYNRWLAMLCTGLYLCIFAVWTIQQPVGWPFRILAVVGALLMVLGSIFGYLAWQDWQVLVESEETPQEITLQDLLRNGFKGNRYVRLTEFRFCNRYATENGDKKTRIKHHWIPVVPVDGQAVKLDGPAPPIPARILAVSSYFSVAAPDISDPGWARREALESRMRRREEAQGYECTVVTGIKKLKSEVRQQLSEFAAQTELSAVVLLDWGKPGSAKHIYGWLAGGGSGLILGILCLFLVHFRAWKVVGVGDWQPSSEVETVQSMAEGKTPPTA